MAKKEVMVKATVVEVTRHKITYEFGRIQMFLTMSGTGTIARKLKLAKGDKVAVTIRALGK